MDEFEVALARAVDTLPEGDAWVYEPKFDGDRATIQRGEHAVTIRSRTGRVINGSWPDLTAAARRLPPCTIDGEIVIYRTGRLDFGAVRARASSGTERAHRLAKYLPASYAAWDVLSLNGISLRSRPYSERRRLLAELLAPLGPPLQPVPMTQDIETARVWWDALRSQGIEGLVAKRLDGAYPRGRTGGWLKIRHADTVEAGVVGFTGPATRPRALAVRLPDGRVAISRTLSAPVRRDVSRALAPEGSGRAARADNGELYTACKPGLAVEVLAGTTRHATVTVTRMRDEFL
ncbi:ATP-dependent DNA ligase [Streptomyces sp. NPDC050428]|uniref:ATP-dependent DNA ligase n=1 Tax=Streptomyces sp. NPDC050428 TaxID=3155757 RepID=UPI003443ED17